MTVCGIPHVIGGTVTVPREAALKAQPPLDARIGTGPLPFGAEISTVVGQAPGLNLILRN